MKTYIHLFLILVCCGWNATVNANDTLLVVEDFYHIDFEKRLIIVNKAIDELNQAFPDVKTGIEMDVRYVFENPVTAVNIGTAYTIMDQADEVFTLYFTSLPIIHVYTENTIFNEPKVSASLKISTPEEVVESNIGIEYRGAHTSLYDKKSYGFELWEDENGVETKSLSLLGMREDDDWTFRGMPNEPLMVRTKTNFDFWQELNTLYYEEEEPEAINGARHEYAEFFLNDAYQGVYLLGERLDRKQLKLKKNNEESVRGELFKGVQVGASTFIEFPNVNPYSRFWGGFEIKYPSDTIVWGNIYDFVDFVVNEDSLSFYENYEDWFHLDNAVDYFIFMNLLRAIDNTGKNLYIARYTSGEPYFYVP